MMIFLRNTFLRNFYYEKTKLSFVKGFTYVFIEGETLPEFTEGGHQLMKLCNLGFVMKELCEIDYKNF